MVCLKKMLLLFATAWIAIVTSNKSELNNYAWYDANFDGKMHPVGEKMPNGLGIYDMTGNTWQLVSDWYDANYYRNSPKNNPQGPANGTQRVIRGGAGNHPARNVRTSRRNWAKNANGGSDLSFRLVRTP